MRDDFSQETKEALAKRVGNRCSNPNCRQQTSGPTADLQRVLSIGVAAHIKAAAPGGKRFDPNQTPEDRKHMSNGIWLCQNCAKMIDSDELRYTVELLNKWKQLSEAAALVAIEEPSKRTGNQVFNAEVISINQSGGQTAKTIINERPVARSLRNAREAIVMELRKHDPVEYEIHVLMNDIEANNLAKELQDILYSAGWTDGRILQELGGTYPPGFTVSRDKPSKASEVITLVLYNSGLKGAMWPELRGNKLCIYIGPNPDNYTGDFGRRYVFKPKEF
jgi:hypothetical protein